VSILRYLVSRDALCCITTFRSLLAVSRVCLSDASLRVSQTLRQPYGLQFCYFKRGLQYGDVGFRPVFRIVNFLVILSLSNDVTLEIGGAIAQAVSRRLPTAAARVRAQIRSCRICGGQSGTGACFLRILRLLRGLSPQANYTDRAIAPFRRS
jgi:hypothetical protein